MIECTDDKLKDIPSHTTYLDVKTKGLINCKKISHIEPSMISIECKGILNAKVLADFSILTDVYISTKTPLDDYSFVNNMIDVSISHRDKKIVLFGDILMISGWQYAPPGLNIRIRKVIVECCNPRVLENIRCSELHLKNMLAAINWRWISYMGMDVYAARDDVNMEGIKQDRNMFTFNKKNKLYLI